MVDERFEFVSKTKDIFLADPISSQGRRALHNMGISMTENEFFAENVYVHPFSEYEKPIFDEALDSNDFYDSDIDQWSYQDIVDLNVLKNAKSAFENNIKKLNDALFIIKGVAGSGKTTYMHNLKYQMVKDVHFHIYDFENVRQSNAFLGSFFDLKNLYDKNTYKFVSVLLNEISSLLGKGQLDDKRHRRLIDEVVSIYRKYFFVKESDLAQSELMEPNIDITEQQELFDILESYANNELNYKVFSERLKNKFFDRFYDTETDVVLDLAYIMGFVIRLLFCFSKKYSKKHLLVVDNIEVFVNYDEEHPIQECELEKILMGCFRAISKMREVLIPIQKTKEYQTFYALLVLTRDTTASTALQELDHNADYKRENEVDISKWYCTDDIYISKKNFCKSKGVCLENNCYSTAYQQILCDFSAYRWGLNGIISKMYKHSHRRNVECVPDAIAVLPKNEIIHFNTMWNLSQRKDADTSSLKNLCRKYILRILIDHVQRKKYFDKLMVDIWLPSEGKKRNLENVLAIGSLKTQRSEKNSYARKISTILHRYYMQHGSERYISFPQLIKAVLKYPYLPQQPTEEQIYDLGKILFLMNETRNQVTNWTSLVCIKFDNSEKYNEHNLCKIMKSQWDEYVNGELSIGDTTRFGVKITEAGSLFAKILADFEYFACRFLSDEPPLFSKENLKPIYVNGRKSYRAVEIIKVVRRRAFDCINEIISRDYMFFSDLRSSKNSPPNFKKMYDTEYSWVYKDSIKSKAYVHPHRILNQHMGYITNYMDYVERYIDESEFECFEDKNSLLEMIKEQNNKYLRKLNKLREEHKEYFSNN